MCLQYSKIYIYGKCLFRKNPQKIALFINFELDWLDCLILEVYYKPPWAGRLLTLGGGWCGVVGALHSVQFFTMGLGFGRGGALHSDQYKEGNCFW